MDNPSSVKKIRDALDLVRMLEHLAEGFSKKLTSGDDVPWAGVRLTLSQSRELLGSVYEELAQEESWEEKAQQTVVNGANERPAKAAVATPQRSLASRIQKAPTGRGRVRELGRASAEPSLRTEEQWSTER